MPKEKTGKVVSIKSGKGTTKKKVAKKTVADRKAIKQARKRTRKSVGAPMGLAPTGGPPIGSMFTDPRKLKPGVALLDTETSKRVATLVNDENRAEREHPKWEGSKSFKNATAKRKYDLETISTVLFDQESFNLRFFSVGRARNDHRIIFGLTQSDGWKFLGLANDPATGHHIIRGAFLYHVPSIFAESVVKATNPILAKMPLDTRTKAYVEAFGHDILDILKTAAKQSQEDKKNENK